ncbi:MAG: nitrogen fixation protein FixH [Rickettsiales bacterium]|jgi:nitrogen fixation protein FixH
MPQNNQNQDQKKTNRKVLLIFICFFSTFIIVDIAYITIATKTWRGLATENGYQKGLKYNEAIEEVKKQKELGWNLKIKYQKKASKSGDLQVQLLDKDNQVISNANLTASIKRPVQVGKDFNAILKFDTKTKTYNSPINFSLIGQWDVEIIAIRNGEVYQDVKRLVVQ